ncbi:ABC transporter permease [Salinispora arenicola]|uniref:ABC transporter permease n=1 Tax=Salinispora arenicola TaxID=168697 RepID=A0A542XI10_SALAC|nr:ABC transporter permease [Salinispora arenicola]MCN0152212.1 ABC transporter permease [Salinispora arenicola]NIL42015.1 ABC transporter permease [Salinispora arenicola]TQL35475.1 nucleoside ABC transporter membrane protein [Salinispora arenicola]GIM85028.1 ABC transporter permease [Salinispora arenicola]
MTNAQPGSPDKDPATADQAARMALDNTERAEPTSGRKPPEPAERPSLGRVFLENLWAANTFTVTLLSLVLAMIVGGVLMIVSDPEVLEAYSYFTARPTDALDASWTLVSGAYANLFKGAVLDPDAVGLTAALSPISETLTYTAPLVFTGLSVALAFRGGLFNIGAQGQATMGVITAGLAGFLLPLPPGLHLLVAVLAGALGGAAWGFIPGILKARTGAHEVINTIMLNYVAVYFLTWLIVQNGIQNPNRTDAISRPVDASAQLPPLFGDNLRAHGGIILAVLVTWAVAWLLNRSTLGFEMRAVGSNPAASRTAGISVTRTYVLIMVFAGALAGLGGSQMVLGTTASALTPLVVAQIGFDGILVALLGRVKPWGVLLAALLFGALQAGGNRMQSYSGVSLELVTVLQALIVIFIAAPALVKAIFQLRAARAARPQTSLAKGW